MGPVCALGMVDLSSTSGLPLWLDRQHEDLILAADGQALRAGARPQRLARSMLLDPGADGSAACRVLWDAVLRVDQGVFAEHGVRHNLLLLGSASGAADSTDTQAHAQIAAGGRAWPEAYGVVHGSALFLLERWMEGRTGGEAADVRRIEAEAGHKVVVPAGYGILMANAGHGVLVLSNMVTARARSLRRSLARTPGTACSLAAMECMVAGPNRGDAGHAPEVRMDVPLRAPEMGIVDEVALYSAFVHDPHGFSWLQEGALPALSVRGW